MIRSGIMAGILIFLVSGLFAQQKDTLNVIKPVNNIIKTNVISLIVGHPSFTYERLLSKRSSMLVTYGYGGQKSFQGKEAKDQYIDKYGGYSVDYQISDFKHTLSVKGEFSFELRYYLSFREKKPPKGVHVGPSIDFLRLMDSFSIYDTHNVERTKEVNNYNITSLSLNCGYQFLVLKSITLDVIISPGYGIISGSETYGGEKYKVVGSGFKASFSINCGFAFGK